MNTRILVLLTVFQVAVIDEVVLYRIGKGRGVNPPSKQRALRAPLIPDPKDFIPTSTKPLSLDLFVVVDGSSYRYHGNDTERYVTHMMNVAASIWRSQSMNVSVTLRLVNTLIFKEHQDYLERTDNANLLIRKFCEWQHSTYTTSVLEGVHFDIAILITRLDIHIGGNYDATGIAYNKGVCDSRYHCAVCEDKSPMILSHTIAHEVGHLLGIRHDSNRNTCPDRVFIMSGYATEGHRTFIWSQCSRRALLEFLSSARANCVINRNISATFPVIPLDTEAMPGHIYNADYQCKMLYGPLAKTCSEWNGSRMCGKLKCHVGLQESGSACLTDGRPALQGTNCGPLMWCVKGFCMKRFTHKASQQDEMTLSPNRQDDKPTSRESHCDECNTFPYMDTPSPITDQNYPSKKRLPEF